VISTEEKENVDESFGPGTDLVISLFACLMILLAIGWYQDLLRVLIEELSLQVESPESESEPIREQLYEFRDGQHDMPFFGKDDAVLTAEAKRELDGQTDPLMEALSAGKFNQLQLIGHASADTVRARPQEQQRWNLALSLERATAVADHLRGGGIPYECMSVTGFGRSESTVLSEWLEEGNGRRIEDWDKEGQYSDGVQLSRLSQERRVEIWGIFNPKSLCPLARTAGR